VPKLDLDAIPQSNATGYPEPYAAAVAGRWYRRLGSVGGLTDFGVSHVTLQPGAWSAQRHWHVDEDECVIMLSGEAVLIDNEGRHAMGPGDIAVFPKGDGNGHHLVNESAGPCVFAAVGRPAASDCHYPDIDMHLDGGSGRFRLKGEA
jgi:uncharacterized cupin superfamily protein